MPLVHHGIAVWELLAGDHGEQLAPHLQTLPFIPTIGFPVLQIRFAEHQSQGLTVVTDGRIGVADVHPIDMLQILRSVDAIMLHGGRTFVPHPCIDLLAHHIVHPHAHHRGWPALLGEDIASIAFLQDEQKIGEAQVGDDLPIRHQMVKPFPIAVVEIRSRREYL